MSQREVVTDLLPLYESGEASPDTRALVEAYFRSDPDFERLARAVRAPQAVAATPPASVAPHAGIEREAVARTRQALKRKGWTFGLALFFTLIPLSFGDFSWRGQEVQFFMWRDEPGSRLFLIAAVYLWWSYWRQTRAMKTAGW